MWSMRSWLTCRFRRARCARRSPFEEWLEHTRRPSLLEDGYFIAVDNGQYVGTSNLWLAPDADLLKTG